MGKHCAWPGGYYNYIVLDLLVFSLIPQRSHHSPILQRSGIRDSSTATLTAIKVESSALIFQNGQTLRSAQEEQQLGRNTSLRISGHNVKQFTPRTIDHNVLWSVDRNSDNIENTEFQYPHSRVYRECLDGWPHQKLNWNQSALSLPPVHSPMHFAVYGTCTKVHHRYPDLSDEQTGWLEAHHCFP